MRIATSCLIIAFALTATAQIVSFEPGEAWEKRVILNQPAKMELVKENATQGEYSAKVFFPGSQKDTWPGFTIKLNPEELKGNNVLSFTAWHTNGGKLGLAYRIDYTDNSSQFGNESAPSQNSNLINIFLFAKDSDGNPKTPKSLIIYRRMPRNDSTVWFDNFLLRKFDDDYRPMYFVAPEGQRKVTNAEKSFGAQLFKRPWMEHVFANVKPLPTDEPNPALTAKACPGEQEPMTLSLYALKNIASAKLVFDKPIKNASGAEIAPEAFKVHVIRCFDKRPTYQSRTYYAQIPVLLENLSETQIPAEESKTFWIEASIPADAKAGEYKGSATLTLDGKERQIPVSFTVRPFVLAEPKDMFWGEYYTMTRYAGKTPEDLTRKMREDLKDMRRMGMTSLGLCYGFKTSLSTWDGKNAKIVFEPNSHFVNTMDAYKELGFPLPIIMLTDSGQSFCSHLQLELGSPEYKAAYQGFWKALQEECKKRGWAELIVQPVDEPGWQEQNAKDKNVLLLKYLKEIPGMRTEQDGPADGYFYDVAGPFSDVWNFNGCLGPENIMKRMAEEKRIPLLYNCDVESYRPVTGRYTAGFFQARAKGQGCFNWAYQSGGGDAYSDFDSKYGDHMHVYPKQGKYAGGPSIGWPAFREGIDDYKYITLLKELIAKNPGEKAQYAQKLLDSILGSIKYSTTVRNAAVFKMLPTENGKSRFTGVLNIANGWNHENYDHARELIAGQIESLMGNKVQTANKNAATLKIAAASADADAGKEKAVYRVTVPQCQTKPVIDGKPDEVCWKNAGLMKDFSLSNGGTPKAQTRAWTCADKDNLYIAVECDEELMSLIPANVTKNQGNVWNDDCVEIFIDPSNKAKEWRQIVVNSLGVYYTGSSNGNWKPKLQTAAYRGSDKWSVEISIPLSILKFTGNGFGLNICRERRPLEVFELSCWSPTGPIFASPERFGSALFGMSWIREVKTDKVCVGKGELEIHVVNPDMKNEDVIVQTQWKTPDGKFNGVDEKVNPGKDIAKVKCPIILTTSGGLEIIVSILDRNGKVLERQTLHRDVPPAVSINMPSPFVGKDWKATVKVDYQADKTEKLAVRLYAASNPKKAIEKKADSGSLFTVSLAKGFFKPLDNVCAELWDTNAKRLISSIKPVVFSPSE